MVMHTTRSVSLSPHPMKGEGDNSGGALAENVNYAVKSSYLLSFLESVPEVAAKLKDAHTKDRKFEDVVKAVEQATVLVLVY